MILAVETFVSSTTFYEKIGGIVKDKGDYNATVQYELWNIVYYNGLAYMVTGNNGVKPPIGTLPSSTTYFKPVTIRGVSGTGLAFHTTWNSTDNYSISDCVPYGNRLYVCIQANANKIPSDFPDYWTSVITIPQETIWSKTQPANQDTGNIWNEINDTDSSYIQHVKQFDGSYLTRFPQSNASFIKTSDGSNVQAKLDLDNKISTYIHDKSGTVHTLTLAGGGNNIEFLATADYVAGDTFVVNGTIITSATTSDGEPLTDGFFKNGNYITGIRLNGAKLNFKSGGSGAVEVFNFPLRVENREPTVADGTTPGQIWVKGDITVFSRIKVADSVTVDDNGTLYIKVPKMPNSTETIIENKRVSGKTIPQTTTRGATDNTTLPWKAGYKAGKIDINMQAPLVYSRLAGVLDMCDAWMFDGSAWQRISQSGSYVFLTTEATSEINDFLYNKISYTQYVEHAKIFGNSGRAIVDAKVSKDSSLFVIITDREIKAVLRQGDSFIPVTFTGTIPFTESYASSFNAVAISKDKSKIAIGNNEGKIYLVSKVNETTYNFPASYSASLSRTIKSLDFNNIGTLLAAGLYSDGSGYSGLAVMNVNGSSLTTKRYAMSGRIVSSVLFANNTSNLLFAVGNDCDSNDCVIEKYTVETSSLTTLKSVTDVAFINSNIDRAVLTQDDSKIFVAPNVNACPYIVNTSDLTLFKKFTGITTYTDAIALAKEDTMLYIAKGATCLVYSLDASFNPTQISSITAGSSNITSISVID